MSSACASGEAGAAAAERERASALAQDLEHAQATVAWLRTTAGAQLSECSLAVAQMSQQVQLANSRLSGEHALQQASWERRLAVAQTEWEHAIDRLRGECASRLREADELLALRAEEAAVAKDESKLLEAKLEFAHKEAAVRSNLLRQLLERVHGAELRESEAARDLQAKVELANRLVATHEEERKRAEAERDVAVAALGILDGAPAYLDLLGDVARSPTAREIAMLKAKLKETSDLTGAASVAKQEAAASRRNAARADDRCAALEARLASYEGEWKVRNAEGKLLQRRVEEARAAAAAAQHQSELLARGRELDAASLRLKQTELDEQAELLAAARAEAAGAIAEAEAARRRAERSDALPGAMQQAASAAQAQNSALRRELAARQAELAALNARLRGQAEAARVASKRQANNGGVGGGGGGGGVGGGGGGGGGALQTEAAASAVGAAAVGGADGGGDDAVQAALRRDRLHAAEAQLSAAQASLQATADELRLSKREVEALQRAAEAEAAQREALHERLESAAELLAVSEQRQAAAEAQAAAAQAAAQALEDELRAARAQAEELRRQQRAWEKESEAQINRLHLARKQEALLREQSELASTLLQQQRAASNTIETEARNKDALNEQLEARLASYIEAKAAK